MHRDVAELERKRGGEKEIETERERGDFLWILTSGRSEASIFPGSIV